MAISHKWKITRMDRFIDTQIVYNVYFAIETTDPARPPFEMIQNIAIAIPRNPADKVIPYNELTEETVINWVKDELKIYQLNEDGSFVLDENGKRIEIGDSVPELLASGERQLEELINPKVETAPLPWENKPKDTLTLVENVEPTVVEEVVTQDVIVEGAAFDTTIVE